MSEPLEVVTLFNRIRSELPTLNEASVARLVQSEITASAAPVRVAQLTETLNSERTASYNEISRLKSRLRRFEYFLLAVKASVERPSLNSISGYQLAAEIGKLLSEEKNETKNQETK